MELHTSAFISAPLCVGFLLLAGAGVLLILTGEGNLVRTAKPATWRATTSHRKNHFRKIVRTFKANSALCGKTYAILVTVALLLATAKTASADTITFNSLSVSSNTLSPSSDTFSLNSSYGTEDTTTGVFVIQTGDFVVGNSNVPDQDISFSFEDTFTINGITQTLTFYGQDSVTQAADVLTIFGGAPVAFGNEVLAVQDFNLSEANLGDYPVNLEATVTSTPEPGTLLLLASGVICSTLVLVRSDSLREG